MNSFYEIEKEEFNFDEFVQGWGSEVEEWGILYMREDNSGSCVTWVKDKGFLDYNKTRNPKPSDRDGETEIKDMIELIFMIEDDDWKDEPESGDEKKKGKKVGKKGPAKAHGTAKEGAVKKKVLAAAKKSPAKKVAGGTKKKVAVEE